MKLDYRVIYSPRRTLGLTVERDRQIVVRAPHGMPEDAIRAAVEAKKLWLYEKTRHAQKYDALQQQKEFVSGETLPYLGRNYRLDIVDEPIGGVQFRSRFLIGRQNAERAGELLRAWYEARARERILRRVQTSAQALGVVYKRVLVSDLRYRWGSCTARGSLNFNWRLIKAPPFVMDYVIVHELAHLLEPIMGHGSGTSSRCRCRSTNARRNG